MAADAHSTKRRVLIVDDARLTRLTLRKTLERLGYDVVEAVNGAEGVDRYKREKPDCVLMDISMPVMDGITALKEIRAFDKEARVAMVTSLRDRSVVTEAMTAGAKDFIVKPYREARLRAALHQLLGAS